MYCNYWQLSEPPFENVPDPRFIFYSDNHDEALMRLVYTVNGRKGACMLTGPVGSGKTTISKVFQQKFIAENCEISIVTNPNLSGTELLQDILYHFGIKMTGSPKIDLIHTLQEKMAANYKAGKRTIIVIDEAHLVRKEVFEELRLLLNYQIDNHFLLTLILAGQPELKAAISEFPQFEQRIPIRYHLKSLNFKDTCRYIHYRLSKSGMKKKIFSADAAKTIYKYSGGIPRKINNICDMSLLAGFIDKATEVNSAIVDQVIADQELQ